MNKKIRQKICIILTLFCMAVIFSFSTKTADESAAESANVGLLIGNILIPGFEGWTEAKQIAFADKIDHPVRKMAHATEYAILGILMFGSWNSLYGKKRIGISWICTTVYAGTDEFHQLFVPGRSGQISDVCIDGCGAIIGILIITIFLYIIMNLLERNRNHG